MKKIDPMVALAQEAAYIALATNQPTAIEAIRETLAAGGSPKGILKAAQRVSGKGFTADTFYLAAQYIQRTGQ